MYLHNSIHRGLYKLINQIGTRGTAYLSGNEPSAVWPFGLPVTMDLIRSLFKFPAPAPRNVVLVCFSRNYSTFVGTPCLIRETSDLQLAS